MTFLWLLILSTWSIANSINLQYAPDNLEQTHGKIIHASVIFRHGDRTPAKMYKNLGVTEKDWDEGLGQLNNKGKQLMYELGKWYQVRYAKTELNKGYRYDRVRVDSSDLERTLESAQLVLAGMFPPQGEEIWDDEDGLNWQPIAVHTKPLLTDEVIIALAPCKKYKQAQIEANSSDEWKQYFNENKALFQRIAAQTNVTYDENDIATTMKYASYVADTLVHMRYYGKPMPDWVQMDERKMNELMTQNVYGRVCTHEMRRLRVGPLLKSIVQDMQNKIKINPRMAQILHMYSGHDITLGGLLITFERFKKLSDPGATMMFELRQNGDQYYVTIFYMNEPGTMPERIFIKGCGNYCTLDNFISATAHVIPEDWQKECDSV